MSGLVGLGSGRIIGGTDGSVIGNTSDRLKVDASITTTIPDANIPTFVVNAYQIATANNKSMISFQNASGSSVIFQLRRLWIRNDQTISVTGVINDFSLRRATSHSAGTLLTAQTYDTADTLSSSITIRTGATITGLAAITSSLYQWKFSNDEWGVGPSDNEALFYNTERLIPHYEAKIGTKPITLRANEALSLQCDTNTTVGVFTIIAEFTVV